MSSCVSRLAALATLRGIIVRRLAQGNVRSGTNRGLGAIATVEGFAGNDAIDFSKNVLKSKFNIAGIEGRGLDEGKVVFASKRLGFFGGNCSQVPQITFVTNKHDDNIGVGVVAQLLQPSCDVLIRLVLADIVNEEGAYSAAVVGRGNGTVSFLTSSIPDLCLDSLGVDLDGARGEFDADGGLGIEVELVASESAEKVGFTNTGVSDQNDFEEEIIFIISHGCGIVASVSGCVCSRLW